MCAELAKERKEEDRFSIIVTHMERLEQQKSRLIEESEKTSSGQAKLGIEKLIFAIECEQGKIGHDLERMNPVKNDKERKIKEIVMHLLDIVKKDGTITERFLRFEIVRFTKCTTLERDHHIYEMEDLGLDYYKKMDEAQKDVIIDIKKFAELRGYI